MTKTNSLVLFIVALLFTSSCKKQLLENGLPIKICESGMASPCAFEEIQKIEEVPDKIKSQARIELLKFMEPEELDQNIEFLKFRIFEECPELEPRGMRYNKYLMYFVRHLNNEVISSICFHFYFTEDQEYSGSWGLPKLDSDIHYKDFLSRNELDSILSVYNFQNYVDVYPRYDGRKLELKFSIYRDSISLIRKSPASARVNINTGEFNSREEWNKATALDINLLPKYGGEEGFSEQQEKNRFFIDSMLQNGMTKREASEELVKQASKHLKKYNPKKAMYLFNKAFLLDSTNANVYWGFGRLSYGYSVQNPKFWYDIGLALDSTNLNLIRAYGHYEKNNFKYQDKEWKPYHGTDSIWHEEQVELKFKLAEGYFIKALKIAPGHLETMSDLADLYLDKVECKNAKVYYEKSKKLRTNCSAKCFENRLISKCGVL